MVHGLMDTFFLSYWHRSDLSITPDTIPRIKTKHYHYKNKESVIFSVQCIIAKVSNGAKIRNRYNQVPHLTQDTNGKVTKSQKTPQTRAKRSALSQQVTTKHI